MNKSLENKQSNALALPLSERRKKVLVSGYYGFSNLGDEAILEELTDELKRIMPADDIVVLSNDPTKTSETFGVRSVNRWQLGAFAQELRQARLFVSGGGGLFQDAVSSRSPVYYGGQITMARLFGVPTLIYAQGLGPLHGQMARALTRSALQQCKWLTVRDSASKALLDSWGISAQLTADPVWSLEEKALPQKLSDQLQRLKGDGVLVALSLRESSNFKPRHMDSLVEALLQSLPKEARLALLPLQAEQDRELLNQFHSRWQQSGRHCALIDTGEIRLPSQWIDLLAHTNLVVGMRLHALIMSLKSAIPVVGIAYDPKVTQLLRQFRQPILNLTKEDGSVDEGQQWSNTLRMAVEDMQELSRVAREEAESAKKLACQNFNLLDRILCMQSDRSRLT